MSFLRGGAKNNFTSIPPGVYHVFAGGEPRWRTFPYFSQKGGKVNAYENNPCNSPGDKDRRQGSERESPHDEHLAELVHYDA